MNRIEIVRENEKTLKKHMLGYGKVGASIMLASKHKIIEEERLQSIIKEINKKCNIFSPFRGTGAFLLSSLMICDNCENDLDKIINKYNILRKKFSSSLFLVMVSYFYKNKSDEMVEELSYSLFNLYKKEKKNHPFLTTYDSLFMLSLMVEKTSIYDNYLKISENLKKTKLPGHTIQSISMLSAILNEEKECDENRIFKLLELLKERKIKYDKYSWFSLLVIGAYVYDDLNVYLDEVEKMSELLRKEKGFNGGLFGLSKGITTCLAAPLVYFSSSTINGVLINNIISQIVTEQTMMAIVCATCVASNNAQRSATY